MTDKYDYDAFGNLIASTGATPNNYLFAGEQFDPALGIYYNRARYYDQRQGRFWTMDSFEGDPESPLSLHKYVYVGLNPVNNIDHLLKFLITSARCTYCLIEPGYQLQSDATDALASSGAGYAWESFLKGQQLVVDGFEGIEKAGFDVYENTLIDFSIRGMKISLERISIKIARQIIELERRHLTVDVPALKKLYKRAKKTKQYIDGYFGEPSGTACKLFWSAELVAQFVL